MIHKQIPYRRRNEARYRRKLKTLSTFGFLWSPAYYKENDGKGHFTRQYQSISPYLKKQASRATRRANKIILEDSGTSSRGLYKKYFDSWYWD